jgi:Uncharacterized conserved protein
MKNVLAQAEQLARAILDSDIYINMRKMEHGLTTDAQAGRVLADVSEKRSAVESLLASNDMDHAALAAAAKELEDAEAVMNENETIAALKESRSQFSAMMANVNQILRFVITGETGEEGGCSGSCDSCSGCHTH